MGMVIYSCLVYARREYVTSVDDLPAVYKGGIRFMNRIDSCVVYNTYMLPNLLIAINIDFRLSRSSFHRNTAALPLHASYRDSFAAS